MPSFVVRAARDEDANEGWVWVRGYPARTVLKLSRAANPGWKFWKRRSVYCQAREIDKNFIENYNKRCRTVDINNNSPTIVMSGWYRDALGGLQAATADKSVEVEIEVRCCSIPLWRSLRAANHHLEITVRLGTRLGVLGVWLGVVGLSPVISSMCSKFYAGVISPDLVGSLPALIVGIAGVFACLGPGKPLN